MILDGTTALITGANRGIGLALAQQLSLQGARILLAGRDSHACAEEARQMRTNGCSAEAYDAVFDAACPRSTHRLGQYCEEEEVDVLVNNAGVCDPGWTRECARRTIYVNVMAPRALTHAVLPGMLRRRRGCVINISSGDGELLYLHSALQAHFRSIESDRELMRVLARVARGRDGFAFPEMPPAFGPTPAYALSKAALNAYTRLMASHMPPSAESNVWLAAVCPGDVRTRMCSLEPPEDALMPQQAAEDIAWLISASRGNTNLGSQPHLKLESGKFWRHREQIPW
mmetsp:Transcript_6839/g.20812  ORF Transcript_6839/g.20812 Transcript_6839/m.20812 type:complete len:286 (-) Transcript_6839:117-974(-)